MKKAFVFICMALFFINIQAIAQQNEDHQKGMDKGIVKKLKLTPDQEKKFSELSSQFQKEMVDLRAKVQKNRIDLKTMLHEGNIDEKVLINLTEANSKFQAEMKSSAVKRWIDINKMLDKDQKVVWAKMLERFAGAGMMMQERMKQGMRNRCGGFMRHERMGKE